MEKNKEQSEEYYEKNKEKCKEYKKQYYEKNKEKIKLYYEKNKEELNLYQKGNKEKYDIIKNRWNEKNKEEKSLARRLKYREEHKEDREKKKEEFKKWKEEHKEELKQRKIQRRREYEKNKKSTDILFKLKCNIRSRISFCLFNYVKKSKTEIILGMSFSNFKLYIESKFEPWMNWKNYGLWNGELNYGWDIDHIIPTSSVETEEDMLKLNHYTNLQPLCSQVNRYIKRDNIEIKN